MSSSSSSSGLRWRDDLPDDWEDVQPWPPLVERDGDDAGLELVDLDDGAVIQENDRGRFVWAQEDRLILDLGDAV